MNRRVFLMSVVTVGSFLTATGLLGCGSGNSGSGATGTAVEVNPYPFAGGYAGTFTQTKGVNGGRDWSGIIEMSIYGLEDRQPAIIAGDEYSPAIEPGEVQGIMGPNPWNGIETDLLGGFINSSRFLRWGVSSGDAAGTVSYNATTKTLTGSFPLKERGTNADIGTISFTMTKS